MGSHSVIGNISNELKSMGIENVDLEDRSRMDNDKIIEIDLSDLGLNRIPESIKELKHLKNLLLRNNELSEVPNFIGKYPKLRTLNLEGNQFDEFPQKLLHVPIKYLFLGNNKIEELPFEMIFTEYGILSLIGNPKLEPLNKYFTSFRVCGNLFEEPTIKPYYTLRQKLIFDEIKKYISKEIPLTELVEKVKKLDKGTFIEEIISKISNPKELMILRLTTEGYSTQLKQRYSEIKESNPVLEELEILVGEKIPHFDILPEKRIAYSTYQRRLITGLNLSGAGIDQFPKRVTKFYSLEQLILDNNKLTDLPVEMEQMENLSLLSLKGNQLTDIPSVISTIPKLEYLILSNNDLSEYNFNFSPINSLKTLIMNSCNLNNLPNGIDNLDNLEKLVFSNNPDLYLDYNIFSSLDFKRLELSNCGITELPTELITDLNVREIDLSNNQIKVVPEMDLHSTKIDLSDNPLESIPKSIRDKLDKIKKELD